MNSINNYSTMSATKRQQISAILSYSSRSVEVAESNSTSFAETSASSSTTSSIRIFRVLSKLSRCKC